MIRVVLVIAAAILGAYIVFLGVSNQREYDIPIFLKTDFVVLEHQTDIQVESHAPFEPDSMEIEVLKEDYSGIWAHLNYLFLTNDVRKGKEYYTEPWFNQLVEKYNGEHDFGIVRDDIQHEIHIQNWSTDGLICTLVDSNVVLNYRFPDQTEYCEWNHLALVLHFQGDHWRIAAMRVIDAFPQPKP